LICSCVKPRLAETEGTFDIVEVSSSMEPWAVEVGVYAGEGSNVSATMIWSGGDREVVWREIWMRCSNKGMANGHRRCDDKAHSAIPKDVS